MMEWKVEVVARIHFSSRLTLFLLVTGIENFEIDSIMRFMIINESHIRYYCSSTLSTFSCALLIVHDFKGKI